MPDDLAPHGLDYSQLASAPPDGAGLDYSALVAPPEEPPAPGALDKVADFVGAPRFGPGGFGPQGDKGLPVDQPDYVIRQMEAQMAQTPEPLSAAEKKRYGAVGETLNNVVQFGKDILGAGMAGVGATGDVIAHEMGMDSALQGALNATNKIAGAPQQDIGTGIVSQALGAADPETFAAAGPAMETLARIAGDTGPVPKPYSPQTPEPGEFGFAPPPRPAPETAPVPPAGIERPGEANARGAQQGAEPYRPVWQRRDDGGLYDPRTGFGIDPNPAGGFDIDMGKGGILWARDEAGARAQVDSLFQSAYARRKAAEANPPWAPQQAAGPQVEGTAPPPLKALPPGTAPDALTGPPPGSIGDGFTMGRPPPPALPRTQTQDFDALVDATPPGQPLDLRSSALALGVRSMDDARRLVQPAIDDGRLTLRNGQVMRAGGPTVPPPGAPQLPPPAPGSIGPGFTMGREPPGAPLVQPFDRLVDALPAGAPLTYGDVVRNTGIKAVPQVRDLIQAAIDDGRLEVTGGETVKREGPPLAQQSLGPPAPVPTPAPIAPAVQRGPSVELHTGTGYVGQAVPYEGGHLLDDDYNAHAATLPSGTSPQESAASWVIARGADTGNEHLVALGADGGVRTALTSGMRDEIVPSDDLMEAMATPGSDLSVHHVHPGGRPLSQADISTLAYPGIRDVTAHTPDGGASVASLGPAVDRAVRPDRTATRLANRADEIRDRVMDAMAHEIVKGNITIPEADLHDAEIVNRILNREGLIKYQSSRNIPDHVRAVLARVLQKVTGDTDAAQEFHRSTVPLRPAGGTDEVPGNAPTAGEGRPLHGENPGSDQEVSGLAQEAPPAGRPDLSGTADRLETPRGLKPAASKQAALDTFEQAARQARDVAADPASPAAAWLAAREEWRANGRSQQARTNQSAQYSDGFHAGMEDADEARSNAGYRAGHRDGQRYRAKNPPPALPDEAALHVAMNTSSGQTTRYKLPPDPDAIQTVAKNLGGLRAKFFEEGNRPKMVDPASLTFREKDQNRLAAVRSMFPRGEGYNPIVAIREGNGLSILDGHNRATVARERGDQVPVVEINRHDYEFLKGAGFDDQEIAYAVLDRAGVDDAASAINRQFPGARVAERGTKAIHLLNEREAGSFSDSSSTAWDAILRDLRSERGEVDPEAAKAVMGDIGNWLAGRTGPSRAATDAMLTDAQRIGVPRFVHSVAGELPKTGGVTSGIGEAAAMITFPRTLAATDSRFAALWDAVKRRGETAAGLTDDYRKMIPTFIGLSKDRRGPVFAAAEIGRLGTEPPQQRGTGTLVAHNANIERAALSRPGETITLDPQQTKAYFELQDLFGKQWTDTMRATAAKLGWKGESLDPTAIRGIAARSPSVRKGLDRVANVLEIMGQQRQPVYLPFRRYGDWSIAVRPKLGTDMQSPGGHPRAVWWGLVESVNPWQAVFGHVSNEARGVPAPVAAKLAEVRQQFPESHYDIEHGPYTPTADKIRALDIPALEKFFEALKVDDSPARAKLIDDAIDQMYQELKTGYIRRAALVPGYSTDFSRAVGSDTFWVSRHAADLVHRGNVDATVSAVAAHPNHNIRKFAKNWLDYLDERPGALGQAVNKMMQVGFYWNLAGNPASMISVATHGPLFGTAHLSMGPGVTRAGGAMLNAMKDVSRTAILDPNKGLDWDMGKVGRTPEEKQFLARMERAGELHSGQTDELAAMARNQRNIAPPELSHQWGRVLDISTSTISAMDRLGRTSIALAAHRLASDPATMKAMMKAWSGNQVLAEMIKHDGATPETLAHFLVTEGAFEWGKTNAPPMARSLPGRMLFQFHNFTARAWSTLYKLAFRMGNREAMTALAFLGAGVFSLAGLYGMPFAQDAMTAYDAAKKGLSHVDPDMEEHIRKIVAHGPWGETGADALLRGPISTALGVDLTSRLGFGHFLGQNMTDTSSIFDFVPAISTAARAIGGAAARLKSHQGATAALGAAAPAAIRNPAQGLAVWPQQGVRSAATGRTIMPPSQITGADEIRKAFGYTPLDLTKRYEQIDQYYRARRH